MVFTNVGIIFKISCWFVIVFILNLVSVTTKCVYKLYPLSLLLPSIGWDDDITLWTTKNSPCCLVMWSCWDCQYSAQVPLVEPSGLFSVQSSLTFVIQTDDKQILVSSLLKKASLCLRVIPSFLKGPRTSLSEIRILFLKNVIISL